MILGKRIREPACASEQDCRTTLDDLFGRAAGRRPDAVAIVDPPDRENFTEGAPRRLTWAQADRAVSMIAQRLQEFGLPTDSVVALQLPNTVESVIMLFGVLRAGLIAAPLPLLWRQTEMIAALGRIGARALVSCRRVGTCDYGEVAKQVAAEVFAIRFVCGFGRDLADGVVPLDDVFAAIAGAMPQNIERLGAPADHVAVVTFDVTPADVVPVARSHAELLAGGLAVHAEARIDPGAAILGALTTASFAGLASTVLPWLIAGGKLSLHQPFAPAIFSAQHASECCTAAVLPGPLVPRLAAARLIGEGDGLKTIVAIWRAPERLATSTRWSGRGQVLIDVPVFGEIGLVANLRSASGKPNPIRVGPISAPQNERRAPTVIEITRTPAGTVAVRGPMVPCHPFRPGVEGDPLGLEVGDGGFVDTGYVCRVDRQRRALVVDGPPGGIVSIGGYRFVLRELQELVTRVDDAGSMAALPDVLAGYRLAGVSADREGVRAALTALGANALLVAAFRDRRSERASAA